MSARWALSGDLSPVAVVLACVLAASGLVLLLVELWRSRRADRSGMRLAVAVSGIIGLASLLAAVLRPVQVQSRGRSIGPRMVLLVDASRSIDLGLDGKTTRRQAIARALGSLGVHLDGVRAQVYAFGHGAPEQVGPLRSPSNGAAQPWAVPPQLGSDLTGALETVAGRSEEAPSALVVVSDGRLDRPGPSRIPQAVAGAMGKLDVPVHTVAVAHGEPKDAAVRSVRMAGAAVAHQPVAITVEVACTGGLACGKLPVRARELRPDGPPIVRAKATVPVDADAASVELSVVLDQAGKHIVEISIEAPEGDEIPDNDLRLLPVDVTRDRVRLLHLAGRPTYDVRALRLWLKSDASLDVVAFFILRTPGVDQPSAPIQELALIPFPVDELFTVHLSSFDAVILQDFDARRHDLLPHMRSLAKYVRGGGGLIMVGGETAFVSGHYERGPLKDVLPLRLDGIDRKAAVDYASFEPELTDAGRVAPVLQPLLELLGEQLPEMRGVNVVGDARPDATVLWTHPWLRTQAGAPMPVLALGEYGNGRTIALGVDSSHRLRFSSFAAQAAGRAHGAFWDAMLGWLMRDPRFEPAVVDLPDGCIAGQPVKLTLRSVFWRDVQQRGGRAKLEVVQMGQGERVRELEVAVPAGDEPVPVELRPLDPGGYAVTVRLIEPGRSAPSRYEFACETGGSEWADPRPDPERLAQIAQSTGGVAVDIDRVADIPIPAAAEVIAERRVRPLGPAWLLSLVAAVCLGAHWLFRRSAGLS